MNDEMRSRLETIARPRKKHGNETEKENEDRVLSTKLSTARGKVGGDYDKYGRRGTNTRQLTTRGVGTRESEREVQSETRPMVLLIHGAGRGDGTPTTDGDGTG